MISFYILLAGGITIGAGLFYLANPRAEVIKWTLAWLLILTCAYVVNIYAVVVAVVIFLCMTQPEKTAESKTQYFLLLLPVLPIGMSYSISAPGITTLFVMTHPRMLVLILLMPLFLQLRKQEKSKKSSKKATDDPLIGRLDFWVGLYIIIISLLNFRGTPITEGIHQVTYNFLEFWVVYYVVSRSIKDFRQITFLLAFTCVPFAFLAIVEWMTNAKTYSELPASLGLVSNSLTLVSYSRGSGLRVVGSSLEPISFGYFLAFLLAFVIALKSMGYKRGFFGVIAIIITFIGINFTGSRGGLLVFIMMIGIFFIYSIRNPGWHKFCWWATLGLLVAAITFISSVGIENLDKSDGGTFKYRAELVENAMPAVKRHLWLGTFDDEYLSDPTLQKSKQGQGIIDIVNTYLFITLNYGLLGLFAFLAIWVTAIRLCFNALALIEPDDDVHYHFGATLLSIAVPSTLFLITTSAINFTPMYLFILFGLISAYARETHRLHREFRTLNNKSTRQRKILVGQPQINTLGK